MDINKLSRVEEGERDKRCEGEGERGEGLLMTEGEGECCICMDETVQVLHFSFTLSPPCSLHPLPYLLPPPLSFPSLFPALTPPNRLY